LLYGYTRTQQEVTMCDLGEISVCGSGETNFGTMDTQNEEMESTGEINGQTRKIIVLRKTGEFISSISQICLSERSFCKTITKLDSRTEMPHSFDANGSVSAHLKVNWGGKADTKFSGGVKAEVKDDKGNYASVVVEQNSDGEGSAEISAGHKEEQ